MPFTICSANISGLVCIQDYAALRALFEEDAESALRSHWSSVKTRIHSRVTST